MGKIIEALLIVLGGVVGAYVVYFVLNKLAELLPGRWEDRIKPYFYVLPAIVLVAVIVLYPTLQTINFSFANADSTSYIGLKNYTQLLVQVDFHQTLFNTLLWIIVAPAATIILGPGRRHARGSLGSTQRKALQDASSSCRWRSGRSAPQRSGSSCTSTPRRDRRRSACKTPSGPGSAKHPSTGSASKSSISTRSS